MQHARQCCFYFETANRKRALNAAEFHQQWAVCLSRDERTPVPALRRAESSGEEADWSVYRRLLNSVLVTFKSRNDPQTVWPILTEEMLTDMIVEEEFELKEEEPWYDKQDLEHGTISCQSLSLKPERTFI